jgi:hypothetical protein
VSYGVLKASIFQAFKYEYLYILYVSYYAYV